MVLFKLDNTLPQRCQVDWFQQIVDTVVFKGFNRIFIKGCCKYYRAFDDNFFKNLKGQAVGNLDILKNQIW